MAKNYFEMIKDGLVVDGGGGTPAPTLIEKSITANGEYSASDDSADGYSSVTVAVENSYTAQDEGKVVNSGALVSQTTDSTTTNGTVDTTTISSLTVNVPNTYAAGDEGKVVSNGALVSQGSDTVTQNGTVDTTLINSLTVNVPTGGQEIIGTFTRDSSLPSGWGVELTVKQNGKYIELNGAVKNNSSSSRTMSDGTSIGLISGLSLGGFSQSQTNWYNSASYTGITPYFDPIDEGTFQISVQSSITFAAKSSENISILHELTTITP